MVIELSEHFPNMEIDLFEEVVRIADIRRSLDLLHRTVGPPFLLLDAAMADTLEDLEIDMKGHVRMRYKCGDTEKLCLDGLAAPVSLIERALGEAVQMELVKVQRKLCLLEGGRP